MIGIEPHNRLVYEGATYYGYGVWPAPYISPAFLIKSEADWSSIPATSDLGPLTFVFREDSFDAVTRVRRGRLYQAGNSQPQEWHVQPHPAYKEEVGVDADHGGRLRKSLHTFHVFRGLAKTFGGNSELAIAIGSGDSISLWSILMIERNFIGEDLITMKARSTLGLLPPLAKNDIPIGSLARVESAIFKVADAAHRESPTSIIDRCRDAAQVVLAAWFAPLTNKIEADMPDLAKLAAAIEKAYPARLILNSSAKIIARLHARAKPNVQLENNIPAPGEWEAQTAVSLLATLLLEIGWAKVKRTVVITTSP
jgi:hypothetical protein